KLSLHDALPISSGDAGRDILRFERTTWGRLLSNICVSPCQTCRAVPVRRDFSDHRRRCRDGVLIRFRVSHLTAERAGPGPGDAAGTIRPPPLRGGCGFVRCGSQASAGLLRCAGRATAVRSAPWPGSCPTCTPAPPASTALPGCPQSPPSRHGSPADQKTSARRSAPAPRTGPPPPSTATIPPWSASATRPRSALQTPPGYDPATTHPKTAGPSTSPATPKSGTTAESAGHSTTPDSRPSSHRTRTAAEYTDERASPCPASAPPPAY